MFAQGFAPSAFVTLNTVDFAIFGDGGAQNGARITVTYDTTTMDIDHFDVIVAGGTLNVVVEDGPKSFSQSYTSSGIIRFPGWVSKWYALKISSWKGIPVLDFSSSSMTYMMSYTG